MWQNMINGLMLLLIVGCVTVTEPAQPSAATGATSGVVVTIVEEPIVLEPVADTEASVPARHESIEFLPVATTHSRYEVIVYTADWCGPCQADKRRHGDGDSRVHLTWTEEPMPAGLPKAIPLYTWRNANGTLLWYPTPGQLSLDDLVECIELETNAPPRMEMSSGVGGSIKARQQIEQLLAWWKSRVGTATARFEWDRTGAQSISLLAGGDWSPLNLYGRSGEFRLSSDSQSMPINSATIGYRLNGDGKVVFRGETVFPESILTLDHRTQDDYSTQQEASIGPTTIITVLSVLHGVWQMLHPNVDLTLGGNVAAEAALENDVLKIRFSQAPAVQVKAWFRFNLRVDEIDIASDHVRIGFGGSRWILKEKVISVE